MNPGKVVSASRNTQSGSEVSSSAGFSLRGFVLARIKPDRLKPVLLWAE